MHVMCEKHCRIYTIQIKMNTVFANHSLQRLEIFINFRVTDVTLIKLIKLYVSEMKEYSRSAVSLLLFESLKAFFKLIKLLRVGSQPCHDRKTGMTC